MEKFQIIYPSPVLSPYVKHYWLLESDDVRNSQRVIPSGNIELIFHRGYRMTTAGEMIPRTSLCGQSKSFKDLQPTGVVKMIAVVFLPFGVKAFFKIPACEFSGLTVSMEELGVKAIKELENKVLDTFDDLTAIKIIETFLIDTLHPFKEYNYERMATAVGIINRTGGNISVQRLADSVYLSKKQFLRVFNEHVGASPKEFSRVIRFHKALFTLQNNPGMSFTKLAYECGYYDQAHLTNEFIQFSGYSPGEYIALCNPYSDYFSY